MRIHPEIDAVSIVLVGELNPTIFTPDWFLRHDIISQEDFDQSNIKVIHPEVTEFQNQWLKVQVERNRFFAETHEKPFVRAYDLIFNTFREHLLHTPLQQLGINRTVHFNAGSNQNKNKIGLALAPSKPWGEWAERINSGNDIKHGGMTNLTMELRDSDDKDNGLIRVEVKPSPEVDFGVKINVNDHFQMPEGDYRSEGSEYIMKTLEKYFESSIDRSENIIDQIMGLRE